MPESAMLEDHAARGPHEATEGRASDGPSVDRVALQPGLQSALQPASKPASQPASQPGLQPALQPVLLPALQPAPQAASMPPLRHWHARLEVRVARRGDASIAVHRRHSGPLRLQKPLYPEGRGVAHLLVVHPPAGIAGGDRLEIDIDVGDDAHALVTTPGATKWYRSDGAPAQQRIALAVGSGACLEWLPQESIVFDGADVDAAIDIACERGATCIGWDIVVLGRRASGERFEHGAFRQDLSLSCAGRPVWRDRARLVGDDALLRSAVGWNGHTVAGLFWAYGTALADATFERCRDVTVTRTMTQTMTRAMARPDAGITRLADGLVVARALSDSSESVRDLFHELWTIIRPAMTTHDATSPRIWST
jgi:urease accessory protein